MRENCGSSHTNPIFLRDIKNARDYTHCPREELKSRFSAYNIFIQNPVSYNRTCSTSVIIYVFFTIGNIYVLAYTMSPITVAARSKA
jgi:hypothetical protein